MHGRVTEIALLVDGPSFVHAINDIMVGEHPKMVFLTEDGTELASVEVNIENMAFSKAKLTVTITLETRGKLPPWLRHGTYKLVFGLNLVCTEFPDTIFK